MVMSVDPTTTAVLVRTYPPLQISWHKHSTE